MAGAQYIPLENYLARTSIHCHCLDSISVGRLQPVGDRGIAIQAGKRFEKMIAGLTVLEDADVHSCVVYVASPPIATLAPPYPEFNRDVVIFTDKKVNALIMSGGEIGV